MIHRSSLWVNCCSPLYYGACEQPLVTDNLSDIILTVVSLFEYRNSIIVLFEKLPKILQSTFGSSKLNLLEYFFSFTNATL